MQITLLGSGSSVPQSSRSSSGAFVWSREDRNDSSSALEYGILVDPSAGSTQRLVQAGFSPTDVTAVLLTHYHPDHVGDLIPLLFSCLNPRFDRKSWPEVLGPADVTGFYEQLRAPFSRWIPGSSDIVVRSIDGKSPDGDAHRSVRIDALPVPHSPVSLAYRLTEASGRSVVFSGDTEWTPDLGPFARGCNVFFLECTTPDQPISGHLDLAGAIRVAEQANAERTVLVHLNPEWDEVAGLSSVLRSDIPVVIELGCDGNTY